MPLFWGAFRKRVSSIPEGKGVREEWKCEKRKSSNQTTSWTLEVQRTMGLLLQEENWGSTDGPRSEFKEENQPSGEAMRTGSPVYL